jgi:hypothetical protein
MKQCYLEFLLLKDEIVDLSPLFLVKKVSTVAHREPIPVMVGRTSRE